MHHLFGMDKFQRSGTINLVVTGLLPGVVDATLPNVSTMTQESTP
jgi:hypothetical protein